MKDKPKESFPSPPAMPSEVKRASELRKREELEKLEEADIAGRKTGIVFTPGTKIDENGPLPGETTITDSSKPGGETKPADTTNDRPPAVKPIVPPPPKPKQETTPEKPVGSKPKGKKGDG